MFFRSFQTKIHILERGYRVTSNIFAFIIACLSGFGGGAGLMIVRHGGFFDLFEIELLPPKLFRLFNLSL